ncbi:MAG TPA: leucine-rich repeat protein [Eubacteriales bacterium]|nr:leucine-rich repeat protein [Eubacteriales bacterium]
MKKIVTMFLIFILLSTTFVFASCERQHTATFAYADGTPISKQKILDGDCALIPNDPKEGEKEFYGWCIDAECTQIFDFGSKITSNITLYADMREPTKASSFEWALINNINYTVKKFTGNETSVIIPSTYKGLQVTAISSSAFCNCLNLRNISIPDSIKEIEYWAIDRCTNLVSIDVSVNNPSYKSTDGNLYTKNGEMMIQYAIGKNSETFSIPDTVIQFGWYTFLNCKNLKSVVIPNSVKIIGLGVFRGCTNLTDIAIPNSVTRIDLGAFEDCESLTSIIIPASVTKIYEDVFASCSNLSNITVDENNANYKSIDGNLYNKDGTTLIQYAIGKKEESFIVPEEVTSINDMAFYECIYLKSVTISDNVTDIGNYTFFKCKNLISVTIPKNITEIGRYVFFYCTNLENIELPESITSIGDQAFSNCTKLANIILPRQVTNIGNYAFCSCSELTSILILDSVTTIGNFAFSGCENLTIYCEAMKKQAGWSLSWNHSNCPVVWGYTGE